MQDLVDAVHCCKVVVNSDTYDEATLGVLRPLPNTGVLPAADLNQHAHNALGSLLRPSPGRTRCRSARGAQGLTSDHGTETPLVAGVPIQLDLVRVEFAEYS